MVLDASAALAYLQGEEGAEVVRDELVAGAVIGAANWSEVAQKVLAADRDWPSARALLDSFGLQIEPVTADDAEWAAQRWRSNTALSLGDRLCLALAHRLDVVALTADRSWGAEAAVSQIR